MINKLLYIYYLVLVPYRTWLIPPYRYLYLVLYQVHRHKGVNNISGTFDLSPFVIVRYSY